MTSQQKEAETIMTPSPPDEAMAQEAVTLAAHLLAQARDQQTPAERQQAARLARMMDDPAGKMLTMQLSDQAFRSERPPRIQDQVAHLLERYGVGEFFWWWERQALRMGVLVGKFLPHLVVPFIIARLRQETQSVILPAEESKFRAYLRKRSESGTRLNVNSLGEAILGEAEAQKRLDKYLTLLSRPDIEYISVKISSIFSQINLLDYDGTIDAIKEKLRLLYRQAMRYTYQPANGTAHAKFVNLDMEEYRDLHLTVAAFKQVLEEEEFRHYRAGIVLQAYLPDSAAVQRELTGWAMQRVANGGASIKLRIVKGANLAMERVEAALHGWEQAPYGSKHEVDANYKRMVTYGLQPERAKAVNIGVASHNLFDISYALLLRDKYNLHDEIEFEMLEGMANHQARAVQNRANGLLLYAPVVSNDDFHSAIAYLVRRLDENTADENFLHDLFKLEYGSPEWNKQRDLFLSAYADMETVSDQPRREQNRLTEEITFDPNAPFHNEPNTDFALPHHQQWLDGIMEQWADQTIDDVPLQINGETIHTEAKADAYNPNAPQTPAYRYSLATPEQIDNALDAAVNSQKDWAAQSINTRKSLLVHAAEVLAQRRGDLLGVMMRDGGKLFSESDPEISEAIDFANYYARSFDNVMPADDVRYEPLGVITVAPPWNFPLAIPTGGVLAALMAGNAVILKPAPETVLTSWTMANALWDAGIPRDVLQFVPTTDDEVGKQLIIDDRVAAVILTGAYDTARMFQGWKPTLRLYAETSGKNSMIITALSDRDQAIKDLVQSAFGHAGQKCSAASLAILEAEVYEDNAFLNRLKDAVASMHIAPATERSSRMSALIKPSEDKLERALTQLESGEKWLLEPHQVEGQANLWTPGIKMNVKPGSFFHQTECFGPVLGLIRADDLTHAIYIANDVDYGLTSGLQSLDDREIAQWRETIQAGNAYINRSTTGAIVQRQPFGGWKRSVFGHAKAGGPNYAISLGTWHDTSDDESELLKSAQQSYAEAWEKHFSKEHDPSQVLGESNVFRYRPIKRMILRVTPETPLIDVERVRFACLYTGVKLHLSLSQAGLVMPTVDGWQHVTIAVENDADLIRTLQDTTYQYEQRLRALEPLPVHVVEAANAAHVSIITEPVISNGHLELRHYFKEQAISQTTHRYGNLVV